MKDSNIPIQTLFEESPISIWREDLSELKKYLDSLKNETKDIKEYFDENPSEIIKCAQLVKIFDVNRSMMELIEEESKNELIGSFVKHLSPEMAILPFKEAIITLSEGKIQNYVEGYTVTKKGKLVYLKYLTYIPEVFASTWAEAWVLVFDLTKYKEKESILNEKASKNEFLLDLLTHDLRNYHTQCQGYIDVILDGKVDQEDLVLNCLSRAKKGIQQATKLLNNVSTLMKTQITKEFVLQPIELKVVLIRAREFILDLYPNQKIVVSIENIPDNLIVHADSLVEYLFINLFTNAVKYNQNKVKEIKVTTFHEGDICIIKIADNARGIPPKMRKDIFTRYSEFQKSGKGSGLGMFISKTLVDRYNGQILIESRDLDDYSIGTQIKIILKSISGA
ncbi:MAG: sensor histidine kinase [Promethearchaeota archaeon]